MNSLWKMRNLRLTNLFKVMTGGVAYLGYEYGLTGSHNLNSSTQPCFASQTKAQKEEYIFFQVYPEIVKH